MSTPNDNKPVCPNCGQWQDDSGDCFNRCVERGFAATQPNPAAVELALAERQANSEKIDATVQAARHPSLAWSPYLVVSPRRVALDTYPSGDMGVIARLKRERDLLQAQRDELLAACKAFADAILMLEPVPTKGILAKAYQKACTAIARATQGGQGQ